MLDHGINLEPIKNRLFKVNLELIHEAYLDGWYLKGLREEKEKLEKRLRMLNPYNENR